MPSATVIYPTVRGAAASITAPSTAATQAAESAQLAEAWASQPLDENVEGATGGSRSALHWATKAEQYAGAAYSASISIYVSTAGNDNATGASAAPFLTLQRAFDYIAGIAAFFSGQITINLAAGTYTEGATLASGTYSKNWIIIQGPNVSRAEPTAIIDGTSATSSYGILIDGNAIVMLKNVYVRNFSATSKWGINATRRSTLYCIDCWVSDCYFGIGAYLWTHLYFQRGRIVDCTYSGIIANDFVYMDIGYGGSTLYSGSGTPLTTDGTYFSGNERAIFGYENVQGTVYYCSIVGAGGTSVGINLQYGSRFNLSGSVITGCGTGRYLNSSSWTLNGTFSGNTTNSFISGGSGRPDSSLYAVENVGANVFLGSSITPATRGTGSLSAYLRVVDTFATLPAGALASEKTRLRLYAAGTINKGGAASSRLVGFRFGGAGFAFGSALIDTNSAVNGRWEVEAEMTASSTSAQKAVINIRAGATPNSDAYADRTISSTAVDLSVARGLCLDVYVDNASDVPTVEYCSADLFGTFC